MKATGHIVMNIIPQAPFCIMIHCHLEVKDWRIKAIERIGIKIMYSDFYLWLNNISEGISTFCSLLASRPWVWSLLNMVLWIIFYVKRFYFRISHTGTLLSMVLVGIFQATSILISHNSSILVANINLVQSVRILLLASVVSGIQFIAC